MATTPLMSPRDMLDIIYAQRNRAYGAYQLRRDYPANLGRAFGLGLLFIAFFLLLPRLLSALSDTLPTSAPPEDRWHTVCPAPAILPLPVMPPPTEMPSTPQRHSTARFAPPDVRPDDAVPEATTMPAQEVVLNDPGVVGTVNQSGPSEAPPSILDPGLDPGAVETPLPPPSDDILTIIDIQKMPSFPGGEAELSKFLAQNIRYPTLAHENGIQGTVALSFVVGKDGSISEVTILKDPGGGCGKEAVRVLKSMPRWTPGEANGHPVRVRFTLPVRFRLQ